jgi:UDP-GlcNAc:undecaprenyl-phosphate GlcNAc-1-phosphate transferase
MDYLWIYLAATVLALGLTPAVIRVSRRLGLMDLPGARKVHAASTPRVGGVAVLISAGIALLLGIAMHNRIALLLLTADVRVLAVIAAASMVFLMGLFDDIKGLRAEVKFVLQTAAALGVAAAGYRISSIALPAGSVYLGFWAWPVTVFWMVSISNAVNLTDGLDGLAGGTALIACGAMAILAWQFTLPVSAVTLMAVMGALTGFLFYNVHPAQVFLGDCGALLLGFLLSVASVEAAQHGGALLALGMLAMCLGVPILDVCTSILRRFQQRRSISAPDRGHIHHKLLGAGLSHPQAVFVLHLAASANALLALAMIHASPGGRAAILTCDAVLMIVFFRRTVAIRIVELLQAVSKRNALRKHRRNTRRAFDEAQLELALAPDFQGWWQSVRNAAERLGLGRLSMMISTRDGRDRTLIWTSPTLDLQDDRLQVQVPIRHRRKGPLLTLRAEIATRSGTQLEPAGQTASHFARLLDEHSIAELPPADSIGQTSRSAA